MPQVISMRIYTKSGDAGETSLFGGPRVRKDATRIDACGTVDELNAALGVVRAAGLDESDDQLLERIQHDLFRLGAELATRDPATSAIPTIGSERIGRLEQAIDQREVGLDPLREFILPGGAKPAAQLHLARCVCRRAERIVVRLAAEESISPELIRYLNRLGDLLFVLARDVNRQCGVGDVRWRAEKE
jgi:cob(I)alamin adenosyltransferase